MGQQWEDVHVRPLVWLRRLSLVWGFLIVRLVLIHLWCFFDFFRCRVIACKKNAEQDSRRSLFCVPFKRGEDSTDPFGGKRFPSQKFFKLPPESSSSPAREALREGVLNCPEGGARILGGAVAYPKTD